MTSAASEFGVITEAGTIRFERLVPGPIERVWEYLTDSEKRGRWLASGPMELTRGGSFEFVWRHSELTPHVDPPPPQYAETPEFRMKGSILEAEPPHLLAHSWNEPDGTSSEVRFQLEERGDKVLLTLTHCRIPSRSLLVGVAGGWHAHLAILEAKLEDRVPPPFWATHARVEREYQARIPAE